MQLHPETVAIRHVTPTQVLLELRAQAGLHYFPNHFPDYPLLPGVVQLNWVMHYASLHLGITAPFSALENVKFQSIVQPGQAMTLKLEWLAELSRLDFVFSHGEQRFSSGRILLQEPA